MVYPLRKYTFYLDEEDVDWFKHRFGWGWSEQLRHLMRRERKELENVDDRVKRTRSTDG